MPESHGKFENSSAAVSNVDSQDRQHAEQEFARFDQGPVDMPAYTPQGSEQEIAAPKAQRNFNTQFAAREARESGAEDFATPMERPEPDVDTQSEATMDEVQEVQPEKDRWAIIRENAARRAARAAEEQSSHRSSHQSRPSQSQKTDRTDDGETSGEESKSRSGFNRITMLTSCSN